MSSYVVDTNVPLTANGAADHVAPQCVLNCLEYLERIQSNGRIVLDDKRLILTEYLKKLSPSGQPGAGDQFMKWVWQNQAVPERCEQVTITPTIEGTSCFAEFPDDPRFESFDRDDRKFVAAALACEQCPPVLNATDSDWWNFQDVLREYGIRIEFLCPELFSQDRSGKT